MQDAFTQGPREKLLYLPVIVPDHSRPDYVVTVDADPQSVDYSKVLNYYRTPARGSSRERLLCRDLLARIRAWSYSLGYVRLNHARLLTTTGHSSAPPALQGGRAAPLGLERMLLMLQ